ncbi:hypothetical protein [Ammoniphilus sp. 3BR4]|uniref:hypothetical protein n=1 Tax=Ammoniphilus sp. 3BR4 TaxID=3158265 RepID=UPI0034657970
MASFRMAVMTKNKIKRKILARPEVTGIGVGFADPKRPNREAAIILYTQQNLSTSKIDDLQSAVSAMIRATGSSTSTPVRIIQAGTATATMPGPSPKDMRLTQIYRNRHRPVPGGVSVGLSNGSFGTYGLTVIKGGQLFLLGNNHVLGINNTNQLTQIVQPAFLDGGSFPNDKIGELSQIVLFRPQPQVNYIDAAIGLPTSDAILDPRYLTSGSEPDRPFFTRLITIPGHLRSYRVGLQVFKTGRATGFKSGVVESVDTDVDVTFTGIGTFSFERQTIVTSSQLSVSEPGDSGSVWCSLASTYAAAVNYGRYSDGRSISYPIHWAMQAFGTLVALPASKSGSVRGRAHKGNFSYIQPLTKAQLSTIRVVNARAKR